MLRNRVRPPLRPTPLVLAITAAFWPAGSVGVSNPGGTASAGFLVNELTGEEQQAPSVAMDADGDFVVVWERAGWEGRIVGRRFDAAGEPAGDEFVVAQGTERDRLMHPHVAMDADGDFVVAWTHKNFVGYTSETYGSYQPVYDGSAVVARRYDAAGVPMGAPLEVAPLAADFPDAPVVAADADGDFAVAWVAGHGSVIARLFGADGLPRGDAFPVTQALVQNNLPALGMDADGDLVVAWASTVDGGIHARAYAADGAPRTDEFRVDDGPGYDALSPAVALDADGDFLVAWNTRLSPDCPYDPYVSYCPDDPNFAVRARRFSADGIPQGTELELHAEDDFPWRRHSPQVTMAADGVAVVTLHRSATRIDLDGSLHPGLVFSQSGDLFDFSVASDADGDYVLTMKNNSDIIGHRFAGDDSVDLSISLAGNPGPVMPGAELSYVVTVTNQHPAPVLSGDAAQDAYFAAAGTATGIAVTFVPPIGAFAIPTVDPDWGGCTGSPAMTCRYFPGLAPGVSASFEVRVSAPSTQESAVATVVVRGDQYDADSADDSAVQQTQVTLPPPPEEAPPPPPAEEPPPVTPTPRGAGGGALSLVGVLAMVMAWLARLSRKSFHRRCTARPSQ